MTLAHQPEWNPAQVRALVTRPHRLMRENSYASWIRHHGGINAVHQQLCRLPLGERERVTLAVLVEFPGQSLAFYEDRLSIHFTTFYERRARLWQVLTDYLNGGAL